MFCLPLSANGKPHAFYREEDGVHAEFVADTKGITFKTPKTRKINLKMQKNAC